MSRRNSFNPPTPIMFFGSSFLSPPRPSSAPSTPRTGTPHQKTTVNAQSPQFNFPCPSNEHTKPFKFVFEGIPRTKLPPTFIGAAWPRSVSHSLRIFFSTIPNPDQTHGTTVQQCTCARAAVTAHALPQHKHPPHPMHTHTAGPHTLHQVNAEDQCMDGRPSATHTAASPQPAHSSQHAHTDTPHTLLSPCPLSPSGQPCIHPDTLLSLLFADVPYDLWHAACSAQSGPLWEHQTTILTENFPPHIVQHILSLFHSIVLIRRPYRPLWRWAAVPGAGWFAKTLSILHAIPRLALLSNFNRISSNIVSAFFSSLIIVSGLLLAVTVTIMTKLPDKPSMATMDLALGPLYGRPWASSIPAARRLLAEPFATPVPSEYLHNTSTIPTYSSPYSSPPHSIAPQSSAASQPLFTLYDPIPTLRHGLTLSFVDFPLSSELYLSLYGAAASQLFATFCLILLQLLLPMSSTLVDEEYEEGLVVRFMWGGAFAVIVVVVVFDWFALRLLESATILTIFGTSLPLCGRVFPPNDTLPSDLPRTQLIPPPPHQPIIRTSSFPYTQDPNTNRTTTQFSSYSFTSLLFHMSDDLPVPVYVPKQARSVRTFTPPPCADSDPLIPMLVKLVSLFDWTIVAALVYSLGYYCLFGFRIIFSEEYQCMRTGFIRQTMKVKTHQPPLTKPTPYPHVHDTHVSLAHTGGRQDSHLAATSLDYLTQPDTNVVSASHHSAPVPVDSTTHPQQVNSNDNESHTVAPHSSSPSPSVVPTHLHLPPHTSCIESGVLALQPQDPAHGTPSSGVGVGHSVALPMFARMQPPPPEDSPPSHFNIDAPPPPRPPEGAPPSGACVVTHSSASVLVNGVRVPRSGTITHPDPSCAVLPSLVANVSVAVGSTSMSQYNDRTPHQSVTPSETATGHGAIRSILQKNNRIHPENNTDRRQESKPSPSDKFTPDNISSFDNHAAPPVPIKSTDSPQQIKKLDQTNPDLQYSRSSLSVSQSSNRSIIRNRMNELSMSTKSDTVVSETLV